eukprot:CAMPEP_0176374746 /NCGR_PEP_ID=MMETSP0126-20121128/26979_1 /TAXON_ID=141414 ORGANISM="Strombidinopsis acuminatum, Strain SPMC142" /NCGR_SAMPLE_ID=MMETSP0126 /ASSEMBLY_ACC=CAM_ASM_000229 /LENGTH=110 /DNA_ID=CAMNT_0017735457 /DNA_START=954 /DNA_END=1286 /DNA_ORIENTATION=+
MKKLADFDETAVLEFVVKKEIKGVGIYTGTLKNGVPDGAGALIFDKGVNYHPLIIDSNGTKRFIFYEGNFRYGSMNGQGTLLCEDDRLYIGNFIDNQFSDKHGKSFFKIS